MAPLSSRISESPAKGFGTLYIVATPIGNLEDITLRALRILKDVDLIAAEGVQHARVLCQHYGIRSRLISYNQHNQNVKGNEIIRVLRSGRDVALISNAGTPGISDPGSMLVNQAIEQNIRVSPIPGASVVTAALSVSGFRSDHFVFLGFLSSKGGRRRRELKDLLSEHRTMILFESPHRIKATLLDIKEIMGERTLVLLREMTKIYEEITRGPVNAVLESLEPTKTRGEFTLVLAGGVKDGNDDLLNKRVQKRIRGLLKERNSALKDIARKVSSEEGFNYKRVYRECLLIKRDLQELQEDG